jgi:tetratricopeptide (TPR) repeat protein
MGRQTARFDEAAGLVGEALGLVPEPGPVRVYALNVKGWLLIQAGDAAAAQKPLTEAMDIGRMLPEAQPQIVEGRLNAATRYYLGCSLLAQGKTAEARQMIEEALALDRESHYPQGIAADLTQLAAIEAAGGRLPEAFRLYERAFNIYLSLKDNRRAGLVLAELERAGREANLEAQVLGLREQLRQVETAAPLRPQAAPQQK